MEYKVQTLNAVRDAAIGIGEFYVCIHFGLCKQNESKARVRQLESRITGAHQPVATTLLHKWRIRRKHEYTL